MDIILGIDPGSRITGYGLIETDGHEYHYIASGTIAIEGHDLAQRMCQIYGGLTEIIGHYQPNQAGIEQVFMHRNAGSALKLGQARGAAIVAIASQKIPLAEYSPRQIKQAIVGYGAADKPQIQKMVQKMLHLNEPPQIDAADALAVAICHTNSQSTVTTTRSSYLRRQRHSRQENVIEQKELIVPID